MRNACSLVFFGAALLTACSSSNNGTPNDAGSGADTGAQDAGGGDSGTPSSLPFSPSNLGNVLNGIDATKLEDVDLALAPFVIDSDADDSGKIQSRAGGVAYVQVTQPNQVKIGVYIARSWTIGPDAIITVKGQFPLALVALTKHEILGQVLAEADGDVAHGGGYTTPATGSAKGGGPGGGAPAAGAATGGTASGGGGYCGAGGTGGGMNASPAAGGAVYGAATISPLQGGSASGSGQFPGGGGGALQFVAGASITVGPKAILSVCGGGGGGGADVKTAHGSGGGGSGGAILLEAPTVEVAGTLAANGGSGGGGNVTGGNDGSPNATPATGGAAGTSWSGGDGAAAATVSGGNGGNGDVAQSYSPGGGGGGAGWIRINTTSGTATVSGTISPATSTTCVTQGKIAR